MTARARLRPDRPSLARAWVRTRHPIDAVAAVLAGHRDDAAGAAAVALADVEVHHHDPHHHRWPCWPGPSPSSSAGSSCRGAVQRLRRCPSSWPARHRARRSAFGPASSARHSPTPSRAAGRPPRAAPHMEGDAGHDDRRSGARRWTPSPLPFSHRLPGHASNASSAPNVVEVEPGVLRFILCHARASDCDLRADGRYRWSLSTDGQWLTLEPIAEACAVRGEILDGHLAAQPRILQPGRSRASPQRSSPTSPSHLPDGTWRRR